MNTTITRTLEKVFQGALTLGFIAMLFTTMPVAAQHLEKKYLAMYTEKKEVTPTQLQANIFPSLDPLQLKVVFFNPKKEPLTIVVRKENQEVVYTRIITDTRVYNSKFDISALPDGNYTFTIVGAKDSYTQPFQISTHTARLTYVQ